MEYILSCLCVLCLLREISAVPPTHHDHLHTHTHTHTHTHIPHCMYIHVTVQIHTVYIHIVHVVDVHCQDSMCECCPGCVLQLLCWKFLSKRLHAVIQNWLLALYEHFIYIHVYMFVASNKYTHVHVQVPAAASVRAVSWLESVCWSISMAGS